MMLKRSDLKLQNNKKLIMIRIFQKMSMVFQTAITIVYLYLCQLINDINIDNTKFKNDLAENAMNTSFRFGVCVRERERDLCRQRLYLN